MEIEGENIFLCDEFWCTKRAIIGEVISLWNVIMSVEKKASVENETARKVPKVKSVGAKPKKKVVKPENPLMINHQAWNRQAVMDILCARVSSSSLSLVKILADGHNGHSLPKVVAVMGWIGSDEALAKQYAIAKERQMDFMSEEIADIADNATNDYMESLGNDGQPNGYVLNGEHVQRSRLRIETRKWLMGKLRPKKYGDKVELAHTGDPEKPIEHRVSVDPAVAAAEYQRMIQGK